MAGLETLPRRARAEVVRFSGAERTLPRISPRLLTALKDLGLPIGKFEALTVEAAVHQAHALYRAWDLGSLDLSESGVTDLSALKGCAAWALCGTAHAQYL